MWLGPGPKLSPRWCNEWNKIGAKMLMQHSPICAGSTPEIWRARIITASADKLGAQQMLSLQRLFVAFCQALAARATKALWKAESWRSRRSICWIFSLSPTVDGADFSKGSFEGEPDQSTPGTMPFSTGATEHWFGHSLGQQDVNTRGCMHPTQFAAWSSLALLKIEVSPADSELHCRISHTLQFP